jgi:hypothetical protein
MGSSFGFLKYGGKARIGSGRGEEKKNSDMGRLLGVAPFKIIKGENWYGVKQISGKFLLRRGEEEEKM